MKLIQDFISQARYLPRALFLAVLLGIAYLFFTENGAAAKRKLLKLLKQRWLAAFIAYLALIMTTAVLARPNQTIKPYSRLFDSFGLRGDPKWDAEIIENILIFIPYTFFYIKAFAPPKPWKAALMLSAITSAAIEICQLVFWLGFFQPADFVHNVLGGMIGCGIWYLIEWIKGRRSKQTGPDEQRGEKKMRQRKQKDTI